MCYDVPKGFRWYLENGLAAAVIKFYLHKSFAIACLIFLDIFAWSCHEQMKNVLHLNPVQVSTNSTGKTRRAQKTQQARKLDTNHQLSRRDHGNHGTVLRSKTTTAFQYCYTRLYLCSTWQLHPTSEYPTSLWWHNPQTVSWLRWWTEHTSLTLYFFLWDFVSCKSKEL